jgi:branched-chain amino acid transport system substrate-binding protein
MPLVWIALAGLVLVTAAAAWTMLGPAPGRWRAPQPAARVQVPAIPDEMVRYLPEPPRTVLPDGASPPAAEQYRAVVDATRPAIVAVAAHGPRGSMTGSGFLYDRAGHIVTSFHVIEGADRIEVIDSNGERHRAIKVQHEANKDLAMLLVPGLVGRDPLLPADGRVEPGSPAIVFGSPLGQAEPFVAGRVMGVGLHVRCEDRPHYDLISLAAAVARGNSGGPVVDPLSGAVIGIVVCRADPLQVEGLSYAIPLRAVTDLLDRWSALPDPVVPTVHWASRLVPVRIGLFGWLTGPAVTVGTPLTEGALLAIREMDAALRSLGYDLDIKVFDTQNRIDLGIEMASQAQYDRDLIALIATVEEPVASAVMPLLRMGGLPVVAPVNTDPAMTRQGWTNYVRLLAPDDAQARAAARYLAEQGARTVYVLDDGSPYGRAMADHFATAARAAGLEIVASEQVGENPRPAAERVAAAGPDALWAAGRANLLTPVLKAARTGGFGGLIIGPDGLNDPRLAAEIGAGRLYFTSPGRPVPDGFKKLFEKEYRKPASPLAALGYDAARLVLEALERYGKENPGKVPAREELLKLISSTRGFAGWMVTSSFDHRGENADAQVFLFGWEGYEAKLVAIYRH